MCVIHPAPMTSVLVEAPFTEHGGLPLHRLFGQQWCHPVVFSAVASSPPSTTSPTSSSTRHCAPVHGLRQAVRVLRRLFRAPPLRHPDHSALCWKVWVPLLASSSTTTSPASPSRPRLLLLHQQQALAPSTPPFFSACDRHGGLLFWSLRLRCLVVHPPLHVRYWQHRCVPIVPSAFPSLASPGMCRLMT